MYRKSWLGIVYFIFAAGCGNGLVGVTGQVTLAGKPLASGTVTFKHDTTGLVAYGSIDSAGRYQLKTGDKRGLLPGAYQAAVMSYVDAPPSQENQPGPPAVRPLSIPARYTRPETAGLKFEVSESGAICDIALEAN